MSTTNTQNTLNNLAYRNVANLIDRLRKTEYSQNITIEEWNTFIAQFDKLLENVDTNSAIFDSIVKDLNNLIGEDSNIAARITAHIEDKAGSISDPHGTFAKITEVMNAHVTNQDAHKQLFQAQYKVITDETDRKIALGDSRLDSLEQYAYVSVTYNPKDGKLTFTPTDPLAVPTIVDLPLELLVEGGHYDPTEGAEAIVLELADGTEISIPVADLIKNITDDIEDLIAKIRNVVTCTTAKTEAVKEITWTLKELAAGDIILVQFSNGNDNTLPSLKVTTKGVAKTYSIYRNGGKFATADTKLLMPAGYIAYFRFVGTSMLLLNPITGGSTIDDNVTVIDKTWSSQKTAEELNKTVKQTQVVQELGDSETDVVSQKTVTNVNNSIPKNIDTTLTKPFMSANSKIVGDYLNQIMTVSVNNNFLDITKKESGAIQSDGTLTSEGAWSSYETSEYIELFPYADYIIAIQTASAEAQYNRIAYLLFDSNKNPIPSTFVNQSDTANLRFNSGNSRYIRISTRNYFFRPNNPAKICLQLGTQATGYVPIGLSYEFKDMVQESGDNPNKFMSQKAVTDFVLSKLSNFGEGFIDDTLTDESKASNSKVVGDYLLNVFNKIYNNQYVDNAKGTLGALQSDGSLATYGAWGAYSTTDFIPLKPNTNYVIAVQNTSAYIFYNRRLYMFYDENKQPISSTYVNIDNAGILRFNSADYSYIRISAQTDTFNPDDDYAAHLTLQEGDNVTGYIPYGFKIDYKDLVQVAGGNADKFMSQKAVTDFVNAELNQQGTVYLEKSGNNYYITSKFNDKFDIKIVWGIREANSLFNIDQTYLIDRATSDSLRLCWSGDDITPIRTFTTVGANHGYPLPGVIATTDKTVEDLGSVWLCNGAEYVLLQITSDGTMIFAPPVKTDTYGNTKYSYTLLSGTMTHVRNATHTADISITSCEQTQLYPSVCNVKQNILVDEDVITEDGNYIGGKVSVDKYYQIMRYGDIVTSAKEHVGQSYADFITDGYIGIHVVYEYSVGDSCNVFYTILPTTKIDIAQIGCIQASSFGTDSEGRISNHTRYVDGTKPIAGKDFQAGVLVNDISQTYEFTAPYLQNAEVPISHVLDTIAVNFAGESINVGFGIGYYPDKTDSKNTTRKTACNPFYLDLRSTGKIYPVGLGRGTMEANVPIYLECYRSYTPNVDNSGNAIYSFSDAEAEYVVIRCAEQKLMASAKVKSNLGSKVEVIEKSTDFVLNSDTVSPDGILYSCNSTYAYAVLKIIS